MRGDHARTTVLFGPADDLYWCCKHRWGPLLSRVHVVLTPCTFRPASQQLQHGRLRGRPGGSTVRAGEGPGTAWRPAHARGTCVGCGVGGGGERARLTLSRRHPPCCAPDLHRRATCAVGQRSPPSRRPPPTRRVVGFVGEPVGGCPPPSVCRFSFLEEPPPPSTPTRCLRFVYLPVHPPTPPPPLEYHACRAG